MLLAVVTVALLASACTTDSTGTDGTGSTDAGGVRLTPLSTRAEYVTNGDVLVALDTPEGTSPDSVRVELDGRDVTSVFAPDDDPRRAPSDPTRLVGLVAGLREGPNQITATVGDQRTTLDVVNHSVDGPLFSGPQQSPFVCTTERNGLGPAEDDCWARTRVRWVYRTEDGRTLDLADPTTTPADAALIDRDGRSVPFVVRVERGVFNRSVTTFATLDPEPGPVAGTVPGPTPARVWDDSGWNGRLVVRFGGGCGATFSQGEDGSAALDPELLADGYAVITSTLTTFQTACNDVVSAETVMVAKEHFSEAYGLPRFTIGAGGSGGAIQQVLIAQNYPGLLDAVAPVIPFPDALTIAGGVADCGLLGRWFGDPAGGATFTDAQRLAVTGFASPVTCLIWQATYLPNIDPSVGCNGELVRAGQVYDPVTNPRGTRCTLQDSNVNLLGTDAETGFALSPLDNVGVQYGLRALADGVIGVDEFLALNEGIGGYDIDGVWQPERTRASDEVLERAYAEGRVTAGTASADAGALSPAGAGGLIDVPVLLVNVYSDPIGDIHDRQRIFAIRDRLRLPDGSANPNVVLWTESGAVDVASLIARVSGDTDVTAEATRLLDQWLTAADEAGASADALRVDPDPLNSGNTTGGLSPRAERLAAARPADATDRCVLPDGTVLTGPDTYAPGGPCDVAYPTHADPRRVAGAPITGATLACTLVPARPGRPGLPGAAERGAGRPTAGRVPRRGVRLVLPRPWPGPPDRRVGLLRLRVSDPERQGRRPPASSHPTTGEYAPRVGERLFTSTGGILPLGRRPSARATDSRSVLRRPPQGSSGLQRPKLHRRQLRAKGSGILICTTRTGGLGVIATAAMRRSSQSEPGPAPPGTR